MSKCFESGLGGEVLTSFQATYERMGSCRNIIYVYIYCLKGTVPGLHYNFALQRARVGQTGVTLQN